MACKIRNLTDSAVQSLITDIVVKTNGLYKPEGTTLTTSAENFSESDLEKMVKDWSIGQYKSTAFTDNWYTVNAGPKEVVVSFAAPTKLIKAYEVKLGLKSLDQANDELAGVEPEALYQETGTTVKPGVQELFNSNLELANQVYEALGFMSITLPEKLSYKTGKIYNAAGKEIFAGIVDGQVYINKELIDKYTNKEILDNQKPILNSILKNLNVYDRLINLPREQFINFLVAHEQAHLDFEKEGKRFRTEDIEEAYVNARALITVGILKSKEFDLGDTNEAAARLERYFPTKEQYIDDITELVAKKMDNVRVSLSTMTGYKVDVFEGSLWGKKLATSSMDDFYFLQGKDGYPKNKKELKEAISKDIARNIPNSIKEKYWREILESLPDDEKALLSNWAYYNDYKRYTRQYGQPTFDFNEMRYPELHKEGEKKYTNWTSFINGLFTSFDGPSRDLWFANPLISDTEDSIVNWYKNLTPEKLDEYISNLSRAMAFKSMVVASFEGGSNISALDSGARKVEDLQKAYYEIKQRTEISPIQIESKNEQITPQQKQQALQLYSQYLESLNKPNTNPILQGNQQEQVKKFAELQERLSNKEFLEGAKGVYESTPALQQLGTQEEYNDYIARVSLGILKNPSSGEYNYTSQVKDIVYRGTPENYPIKKGISLSLGEGITFTSDKDWAKIHTEGGSKPTLYTAIINIKNPIILKDKIDNLSEKEQDEYVSQKASKLNDGTISLNEFLVVEPEQIHILGNKEDIEGFKEFVGRDNVSFFRPDVSTPTDNLDRDVSIKLPDYRDQVEEFFENSEDNYNPGATYSQEQTSNNFGNEAISSLMQVLSDNLGVPFETVASSEEAAMILKDSGIEYRGEPAFFYNGKVYFVEGQITAETVFHEFAHPLIQSIRIQNPKLFNALYEELISTPEGQKVLARVQRNYDYTGDRLKEEVIVTAMGLEGQMRNTGEPVSKQYKSWIEKILFHIKQLLRGLFGKSIKIEKLNTNTSIKQLVDMMTGEKFALSSEVFTNDEVAEFIRLETREQIEFVNAVESTGASVLSLIDAATVSAQEFEQLVKRSSDNEIKALIEKDSVFDQMRSQLMSESSLNRRNIVNAMAEDAIAKNRQAAALARALFGYNQVFNVIVKNINALEELKPEDVTPDTIARIMYYRDLALYVEENFINPLQEVIQDSDLNNAVQKQGIRDFKDTVGLMSSSIFSIKRKSNKILEEQLTKFLGDLTKDMRLNIEQNFGERFKNIVRIDTGDEAFAEQIAEKLIANQPLTEADKSKMSRGAEAALKAQIKNYKGVEITPEKIRAELVGEGPGMNWLNAYLESYSASQSLISGPFFAYLKNKYAEIDAETARISNDLIEELQPFLKNLSKNEILLLGKALAFEDAVADIDEKGELVLKRVWSYMDRFKDYRFDLSQLEFGLQKAIESKDQTAIRAAYKALEKFKSDYMWQMYDREYYDVKDSVYDKNDVTRDALMEKEIILTELRNARTPLQTELDRFNSYSNIRSLERQLKELSKLTYEDGTPKIDDPARGIFDLTKAKTHQEYAEKSRKFYEYKLKEGAFEKAFSAFEDSLIAEGLNEEEREARLMEWLDQNTRVEFNEKYFDDKQRAIQALTDFINAKFPAGARNTRITEIHSEINDLLILARDPSGQIDVTVLSPETFKKVKDLQEEIVQIQREQVGVSGLSSVEWDRYNELNNKTTMHTPSEATEFATLRAKKDTLGLSKADKDIYYRLLGAISDLTTKEPNQDYVDTINFWMSKLGRDEVNAEEAAKISADVATANFLMSLDGSFKDWFLANHVQKENKDGVYYERLYLWNIIRPTNESYLKTTTVKLKTGKEITVKAVPGSRFYDRSVKKEYKLLKKDDWSSYVGVYIDNTNLSENPNFLPRPYIPGDRNSAKDDRYINKEFEAMDKNSDIYKILEIMKKYHLQTQNVVSTYGKLYLDLPRFGIEDNQELILRGEIKKKALRTWTQIKGLVSREAREKEPLFRETADSDVNYDSQKNMVRVNALGEEQEYIPIGGLSRLETDQVSLDVIRTFHKYLFSAMRYKQLSDMDPLGRALKEFTGSEQNAQKNTKLVNRNIARVKGITKYVRDKRRQDLRAAQISHLYDREFLGIQNNSFGNNPYLNKITKFFMKQVSFGFFALDLVSATKNWGGQIVQNAIEAAGGKNITLYSLAVGSRMAHQQMVRMQGQRYEKGLPSLQTQMMLNFDPGQSYFNQNFGKTQSRGFISDVTSFSFFMSPRKFLERQSVLELFFGMMHHKIIERTTSDGKKINIRYIDAWELDASGKMKLKDGVDKKYDLGGTEYAKFKTLMQNAANKLYGAYADIDQPMANKFYAYKVTSFLRKYFTEMFMNRFGFSTRDGNVGGYRYNWAMNTVERGYYVEGVIALIKMANVSNKYWKFMSKEEKYALRKILMEVIIIAMLYMMSTILFGYDPDDEDRYKKLRAKSGDMFSNNFNVDWWLAQHLILFSKNVFAETTSFIPLPKLGLEDLRENADLTSLVFGRSIGQMGTLMKDMFYMSIGSEKAKYTRNVGPFSWQEKGSYKIMNHTLSLFGVKGKFYDPVGRGIMPQESVEARK